VTLLGTLRIIAADKAKLALAVSAVAVTAAGGVTFGSWTVASSAGNGYAKALSAVSLTVLDASAATTSQLYPGGSGDLYLKVTNSNPFAVTITSVTGNGAITSDKGAACNAATGVSFTNTSGLSQVVGAAGATVSFSLPGKIAMSTASDTTCQGAIFSVPVTLTATS
jgi:hypothetical protein